MLVWSASPCPAFATEIQPELQLARIFQCKQGDKPRSEASQHLLDKIARAGAIAGAAYGMYAPEHMEGALRELLVKGYVTLMNLLGRSDHRHYTLSERGRSCVKHCVELTTPTPFLSFKRVEEQPSDSREEPTTFELIGQLTQQGWKDKVRPARQRLKPFTAKAELIWYRTELQKPSKLYLRVLLTALLPFSITKLLHGDTRRVRSPSQPTAGLLQTSNEGTSSQEHEGVQAEATARGRHCPGRSAVGHRRHRKLGFKFGSVP